MRRTVAKPIPEPALTARQKAILVRQAIAGAVVRRSINDRETGGQKTVLKTIRVPSGSSPVQKAGRTVFANQVSTRTLN